MSPATRMAALAAAMASIASIASCSPKAPPLRGALAPNRLPSGELPHIRRKLVFQFVYQDANFTFRGDGAARIAPPDSARLDFFLNGGLGSGFALLIGDSLATPGADFVRDLLPPPGLLWAALGRLRVPAVPDTVVRIDADTTRADIGTAPRWRAAFVGDALRSLDLIDGDRIVQSLQRDASGSARYQHFRGRRKLELTITRVDTVPNFDSAIWH